jgi:hypothetical protein
MRKRTMERLHRKTRQGAAIGLAPPVVDRLWRWLVLGFVATVLLHGCHGDEDNELFTRLLRDFINSWPGQQLKPLLKLLVGPR